MDYARDGNGVRQEMAGIPGSGSHEQLAQGQALRVEFPPCGGRIQPGDHENGELELRLSSTSLQNSYLSQPKLSEFNLLFFK